MAVLHSPHLQVEDANGNPYSGALLYFYSAGTTTDLTTYQDSAGATPHAQPVVADSSGLFAAIYVPVNTGYKTVLKTSGGTTILTTDNITIPVQLSQEDQVVTGGALVVSKDLGTISSGTTTPAPGDRPIQRYINGGAHTLAPGSEYGYYILDVTNNASAGSITTSGWTKATGGFDTTNGHKFRCFCSISEAGSLIQIVGLF
jgi:hypothetical protein